MKAHTADYYITVGYWQSDMADPPVSISLFAMMLTTIGQQVTFLQDKNILPKTGLCRKCYATILGEYKVKKNERYWRCTKCNITTSLRFGTILYQTKLKLINFIMLVYCFTERNRTNAQTSNKASLPQENYKDITMLGTTNY